MSAFVFLSGSKSCQLIIIVFSGVKERTSPNTFSPYLTIILYVHDISLAYSSLGSWHPESKYAGMWGYEKVVHK